MKREHTPGPWTTQEDHIIGDDGHVIATIENYDEASTKDQDEANARLIAAAPELLDLLKRINTAFYADGTAKALRPVMAETKAMIRRAEGSK